MDKQKIELVKSLKNKLPESELRKKVGEIFGVQKTQRNEIYNKIFGKRKGVSKKSPPPHPENNSPTEGIHKRFKGDVGEIDIVDRRVVTLEDLLEVCEVDPDIWEVEKYVINKWEVARKDTKKDISWNNGAIEGYTKDEGDMTVHPLYQVKAWLKKKVEAVTIKKLFNKFIKDAEIHAPKGFLYSEPSKDKDCALILNLQDVHLGKLAWGKETNGADWDLNIAKKAYGEAVADLMAKAPIHRLKEVILIVGSDFFQVDTPNNTTTAGTSVDADTRWTKAFSEGCDLLTDTIESLASQYKVTVMSIPGNHDETKSFYMGSYLGAWFRKHSNVFVNNEPNSRKYYGFGKNLIGFVHGNKQKLDDLPLTMMKENQSTISNYKWNFFLTGHLHHDKMKEIKGTKVMVAPALCASDAWHHDKGYIGCVRTSQGILLSEESGLEAIFYSKPIE